MARIEFYDQDTPFLLLPPPPPPPLYVCVCYQLLDAAQHGHAEDAGEDGEQVERGQRPDEEVESEDVLAASDADELVVVAQVASAGERNTVTALEPPTTAPECVFEEPRLCSASLGAVVQVAAVARPAAHRHVARLLRVPTRHLRKETTL